MLIYDSCILVGRKKLPVWLLSLTTKQLPTTPQASLTQRHFASDTSLHLLYTPQLGYLTVLYPLCVG